MTVLDCWELGCAGVVVFTSAVAKRGRIELVVFDFGTTIVDVIVDVVVVDMVVVDAALVEVVSGGIGGGGAYIVDPCSSTVMVATVE